jgi:hypothetical protein
MTPQLRHDVKQHVALMTSMMAPMPATGTFAEL